MVYLDANVFLFAILNEKTVPLAKSSADILEKTVKKEIDASTSFLTWDEVVWNVRKYLGSDIATSEGEKFLKFPNLNFIKIDENIISSAQNLTERYGLKPRDAIHAASAMSHNIGQIITDDPHFDKIKEIKRIPIEKFSNSYLR